MHVSQPVPGTIEFLDITSINPLISKCKIKVCYVGDEPNRNRSIITEDAARKIAQSLPGSPIVGYFNEEKGDFEEHNRYFQFKNGKFAMRTNTRPYGFVDTTAKVWFEEYLDDYSDTRKYLVTEGYIWTGQYPESKAIFENSGRPQSLQFEENNYLDAFWTKDGNGNNQFFIVNEAVIENLCILGGDVEPCFEGSSVTQFSLEQEFKDTMYNLMTEMKNILEGGLTMAEEKIVNQEETVIEEVVVDTVSTENPEETVVEQVVDNPVTDYAKNKDDEEEKDDDIKEDDEEKDTEDKKEEDEDEEDKKKKTSYSLEEIPEYVSLKAEFDALQTSYSSLESTVNELKAYKEKIETKEKEALIKSFYMLSDEDKADVVENIATYSFDEIKSKLSVICVDKKVSFDKDETVKETEDKTNSVFTYNLDDADSQNPSDSGKPAWLKRVDRQIKK